MLSGSGLWEDIISMLKRKASPKQSIKVEEEKTSCMCSEVTGLLLTLSSLCGDLLQMQLLSATENRLLWKSLNRVEEELSRVALQNQMNRPSGYTPICPLTSTGSSGGPQVQEPTFASPYCHQEGAGGDALSVTACEMVFTSETLKQS